MSIPVLAGELDAERQLSSETGESLREIDRLRVSLPQPNQDQDFTFTEAPPEPYDRDAADPPRREVRPTSEHPAPPPDDPTAASEDW